MRTEAPKDIGKSQRAQEKIMFDIHKAIQEISYGSVQIHIQDGKVVQVDKISKLRMR